MRNRGRAIVVFVFLLVGVLPALHVENVRAISGTPAPTLSKPASSSLAAATYELAYSLPVAPSPGTVHLSFQGFFEGQPVDGTGCVVTLDNRLSYDGTVSVFDLTIGNGPFVSATCARLETNTDITFDVTLSYQDEAGDPAAFATSTGIVFDALTVPPSITSPTASTRYKAVALEYSLPEAPKTGTVAVDFYDYTTAPPTLTCTLTMVNEQSVATTIAPASPTGSSKVTGSTCTAIPDGTYTVGVRYQDAVGNPAGSAERSGVVVDTATQAPSFDSPSGSGPYGPSMSLAYTLPETPTSGSVSVTFDGTVDCTLTMSNSTDVTTSVSLSSPATAGSVVSSSCSSIAPDTYTLTLTYSDDLANPASSASKTGVVLALPPSAPDAPTGTAKARSVALAWTAPAANGSTVSDYIIRYRSVFTNEWTVTPYELSAVPALTVTGLTNGIPYEFQVAGVNEAGTGEWSASSSTITPRTVPSRPSAPSMLRRNGGIVVVWSAPANGGSSITDYVIQYRKGSGTWTTYNDGVSPATKVRLTLPKGTYTTRVAAKNVAGRSAFSKASTSISIR